MACSTAKPGKALVIVPTYNERASMPDLVRRLFAAAGDRVELLVIDDGSPDGTADVVRQLARERPGMHLIERAGKQGLGSAYRGGFRWGIEREYWALVEMDGDLSHDPGDVPRLLQALRRADLVVGSRYVPGGSIENWSQARRALSKAGNVYARAWLGRSVADWTSGFRAYRASCLAAQDLETVRSEGYAFQIEMTRRLVLTGGRIVEVPITFVERATGKSKMSRRIVAEALLSVARWGIQDRLSSGRSNRALKGPGQVGESEGRYGAKGGESPGADRSTV
ncbi:MAG: polyprenol monophosphomannose synthase [Actinomycetota bacterium]|nr:polyprenol monophosphomannose synthase [Actinomycetota bacterium]